MNVSAGKPFSTNGWTGRSYELAPDTPGKEPRSLELSVPDAYADWISDRAEAPVLAALFPAMSLGETIRTDQPLSEKFHYNLRQVMKYFHLWYPSRLSTIDIECGGTETVKTETKNTLGCFSGGVDSYYTLMHHRPSTEPLTQYQMTHGLFVHGFDIPVSNTGLYDKLSRQYEHVLNQQDVELVQCRTNLREFLDTYEGWMTTHGVGINMAAHFLSRGFNKFLIPSTNRFSLINPPIGSNPITDPQPASESFEIIHHGCEASRIEKTMAIADWEPVQKYLRVCWQNIDGQINCGKCNKCHKVMMPLWLSGKLDSYTCFPVKFDPSDVSPECFAGFHLEWYAPEKTYAEELTEIANRYDPDMLSKIPIPVPSASKTLIQKLASLLRRAQLFRPGF